MSKFVAKFRKNQEEFTYSDYGSKNKRKKENKPNRVKRTQLEDGYEFTGKTSLPNKSKHY